MKTMCKLKLLLPLAGILSFGANQNLLAHTCPDGATDTGVGGSIAVLVMRNGQTLSVGGGVIGSCECVFLRGLIRYDLLGASGGFNGAFEKGTVTISTVSGSFTADVTPVGGVPLLGPAECGGVASIFTRDTPTFCPADHPADIAADGTVTFIIRYGTAGTITHIGVNDILNAASFTQAINVNVRPAPTCSIAPLTQVACAGGSATFTATATPPNVTYAWRKGCPGAGNVLSTASTLTLNNVQPGDAGCYELTVTDAFGCTSKCQANLQVSNPSCTITGPTPVLCSSAGNIYSVSVTGCIGPETHTWSISGNGTIVGPNNGPTVSVTAGASGSFTVTVTGSCDNCPFTCSKPVSITPCVPHIQVLKEVACATSAGCPATGYAKTATGVRDGSCPAFCYRITVTNPATNPDGSPNAVPLVNITLSDPSLNLTACNAALAGVTLQPGQSTTPCIAGPVEHCADFVNTVTARAASAFSSSDTVTATDTATVRVLNINIVCDITLASSVDMDEVPGDNHVTLPAGSVDTPITFNLTLRNTGTSPLNVTALNGLPSLVDCVSGAPIVVALPINIAAGGSVTISGCVLVSCPPQPAPFSVSAHAEADAVGGTVCVFDIQGRRVADDSAPCTATVSCATPTVCRVTGGGVLLPGFVDQSCTEVNTTIFPFTSPNGLTIKKITHGGQLGAPFSQMDCGTILGNPCIRGQWQHTRHYEGTANPRDVIDMDFHSQTPKGQYDSLSCACLGCCDPITGVFIAPTLGPLIHKFQICNPDDHKVCGPQPRPSPANAIIWSGIGKVTPTDDVRGSRAAQAEWVVFRVYIEDRSEPGGGHPGGAVEPADIYCFQAWKTGIKVSKKPDFSTISAAFRTALGEANCAFLRGLENGAFPIGTLPSPDVNGLTADIQDCGPLHDGNHQIHPATGATCE